MINKVLVVTLGLLFVTSTAFANISLVQSKQSYTGGSPQTLAFGSNIGANDLLIVAIHGGVNAATQIAQPTVTDTNGSTWLLASPNSWLSNVAGSTKNDGWIFYALSTSSQADSITVTGGASQDLGFHISEWSGTDLVNPIGATTSTSTTVTSSNWTTNNLTTTRNNSVIFAQGGEEYSGAGTASTNGNYVFMTQNSGQYSFTEYMIATTSGSYAASSTYTLSEPYDMMAVVIQPPAAASTASVVLPSVISFN